MSGTEIDTDGLSNDGKAAEYVLGTLRGIELSRFSVELSANEKLQQEVRFWENQLANLNALDDVRAPAPTTWRAIEKRIKPAASATSTAPSWISRLFRSVWLPWGLTAALAAFLFFNLSLLVPAPIDKPPVDYVAVMTDTRGDVKLSATARASGREMWLHWQNIQVSADQALQIWAVSKTDGSVRSLVVLANPGEKQIELSQAQWGLIKDAETLLLTVEASGGSTTNTPSSALIAKGVCVRVSPVI